MDRAVHDVLRRTTVSLTKSFHDHLLDHGWDSDVVSRMTLDVTDDGKTLPSWPDDVADRVMELEMGSQTRLPTNGIGSFFDDPQKQRQIRETAKQNMGPLVQKIDRMFGGRR